MDTISRLKRSETMSKVRSSENKSTDILLARLLRARHITGWRSQFKIIGRPDFAWKKERVAVFVDGCFWHGCPFCYRRPKSNIEFWTSKVQRNQTRDRRVNRILRGNGWSVIRVRECLLKTEGGAANAIARILRSLHRN